MSKEIFEIAKSYALDIEEAWQNEELMDYIDEHALDIEYTISSNMDFIGAEIAVALGGPSVYINTRDKRVEAYWSGEQGYYPLDSDLCYELDELFEDMYQSAR
jgi:hypothetical protein